MNKWPLFWVLGLFCWEGFSTELSKEDALLYQRLEKNLKGQAEFVKRKVWRSKEKEKTVELESFISREIDVPTTQTILADTPRYREWALKSINVRPDGGKYRIRVNDLISEPKKKDQITLDYAVELPMCQLTGQRMWRLPRVPMTQH